MVTCVGGPNRTIYREERPIKKFGRIDGKYTHLNHSLVRNPRDRLPGVITGTGKVTVLVLDERDSIDHYFSFHLDLRDVMLVYDDIKEDAIFIGATPEFRGNVLWMKYVVQEMQHDTKHVTAHPLDDDSIESFSD